MPNLTQPDYSDPDYMFTFDPEILWGASASVRVVSSAPEVDAVDPR